MSRTAKSPSPTSGFKRDGPTLTYFFSKGSTETRKYCYENRKTGASLPIRYIWCTARFHKTFNSVKCFVIVGKSNQLFESPNFPFWPTPNCMCMISWTVRSYSYYSWLQANKPIIGWSPKQFLDGVFCWNTIPLGFVNLSSLIPTSLHRSPITSEAWPLILKLIELKRKLWLEGGPGLVLIGGLEPCIQWTFSH